MMISGKLTHRLDAIARLTGIPQLTMRIHRRRPMRWLPLGVLLVATIGLVAMIALQSSSYFLGMFPVTIATAFGSYFMMRGPIKPWGAWQELTDERDQKERARAYLFTFSVMLGVSYFGFIGLAVMLILATRPTIQLAAAMMWFANYLVVLYATLPTLYASWTTKPLPSALDDDGATFD